MNTTRKQLDFEILKLMKEQLEKNKTALPVVAVLVDIELNEVIDFSINDKIGDQVKEDSNNKHAEQKLLKSEKIKLNNEYKMIINIPPCEFCMNEIHNSIVNIKTIEFLNNYQLKKKISDLDKKFNLKEDELKFKLLSFNHNGDEELIFLVKHISKYYEEYQTRTRLYIWYMVNFKNYCEKYMYIEKSEYEKFKTFFEIINNVAEGNKNPVYKIRNEKYKIRIEEIKKYVKNLPESLRKAAIKNYKNKKYFRDSMKITESIENN